VRRFSGADSRPGFLLMRSGRIAKPSFSASTTGEGELHYIVSEDKERNKSRNGSAADCGVTKASALV